MFNLNRLRHSASVFLFLIIPVFLYAQDTAEELKKKANKLFDKEQYVEATTLYSRVLPLEPRNFELNFKYGACLLYNSNRKGDALKYLQYAVTNANIDPRAYFFLGKAFHLDYQFDSAVQKYQKYISKRKKADPIYDAERGIQMCKNGERLLTSFTDIVVTEKQEVSGLKFYKMYSDAKLVGGDILVSAQFQSKLDKKKGHVPIVHFPPNADVIYYASYGNDLSTGKDIFTRRRLPDGIWGKPELLSDMVNTSEDEDFPYMHPSGEHLYFSSKGHNSMGGYDVFVSQYDPVREEYGRAKNVDFAISSPDDDLFYIVDSLFENAYFTSARQSQDGKVHVYRVKVARVPMKNVIVIGGFESEVDPNINGMTMKLFSPSDNLRIGTVRSDAQGDYSFVFPGTGKYNCEITIEGENRVYRQTIEVPFLDEFRPIKQKIVHTFDQNGEEVVHVLNLLDEDVPESNSIIAGIIREKAQLAVNIDDFDLEAIEVKNNENEIRAELGFQKMSSAEIVEFLYGLVNESTENDTMIERLINRIGNDVLSLSQQVVSLDVEEKAVAASSKGAESDLIKYELLMRSEQLQNEKKHLINQIGELEELKQELQIRREKKSGNELLQVVDGVKKELNRADVISGLKLLKENKEVLEQVNHNSIQSLTDSYLNESIDIRGAILRQNEKLTSLQTSSTAIETKLNNLELRFLAVKKKDKDELQRTILETKQELKAIEQLIASVGAKKNTLELDKYKLERRMELLQKAKDTDGNPVLNPFDLESAVAAIEDIANQSPVDYKAELELLKTSNAEISEGKEESGSDLNLVAETEFVQTFPDKTESSEETEYSVRSDSLELSAEYIKLQEESPNIEDSEVTIGALKRAFISEIAPNYSRSLERIASSSASDFEKRTERANTESEVLDLLRVKKQQIESKNNKLNKRQVAELQINALEALILEHELVLDEILAEGNEMLTDEDRKLLIASLDRRYANDMKSISSFKAAALREEVLQQKIQNEINKLDNKGLKSADVSIDLVKNAYELLLAESEQRRKKAFNAIPVTVHSKQSKEDFITSEREAGEGEVFVAITSTFLTRKELAEQEVILNAYQSVLETKIINFRGDKESESIEASDRKLKWLEEEKELVVKKRKSIRVSIGQLESALIVNTEENTLDSVAENSEFEYQIAVNPSQVNDRKDEVKQGSFVHQESQDNSSSDLIEKLSLNSEERTALIEELTESSSIDFQMLSKVKNLQSNEEANLSEHVNLAKKSGSEAEKRYLLKEAQKRSDQLNDKMAEIVHTAKIISIEQQENVSLESRNDLNRRKRNYSVRIGALEQDISRYESQILVAKRRDIPQLNSKKKDLEIERDLLVKQLEMIDFKLSGISNIDAVVGDESRNTELTFKEERAIASSVEYEIFYPLASAALKVENEIRILEQALEDNRALAQRIISFGSDEKNLDSITRKIKRFESELADKQLDAQQKKQLSDSTLPKNREEAMKMQNIAARGILPIKAIAFTAASVMSIPLTGLAIDLESERVNHGAREVPIGMDHPSGLVYRVQIGAFSKPLPSTVFKEFNPVSGEKIEGTSIIRYMAGFFNSSDAVVDAKANIRSLGYNDAFVVAYCDGKRISFGEARRLQASGECIPKGLNEIVIEVAEKTAIRLGFPVSREVPELSELDYMIGPDVVDADPVEPIKGLFFTVQVGVFNTSVKPEDVFSLPEMITYRLPNGHIRYSTGYFDSREEAKLRLKMARESGVQDAFITAYYNGERISLSKAQSLLFELGDSILKSAREMSDEEAEDGNVQVANLNEETSLFKDEHQIPYSSFKRGVQLVTKSTFDRFPRDVLNRYNARGSFYFDKKDKKVKSVIYRGSDRLPNIWNFKDDLDTVYLKAEDGIDSIGSVLSVTFSDSIIPGDFMDFLLRFESRREVRKNIHGVEILIFVMDSEQTGELMDRIRLLGIEPRLIYRGK